MHIHVPWKKASSKPIEKSVRDISKQVNILDTIMWTGNARNEVSTECISNCFKRGGFGQVSEEKQLQVDMEQELLNILQALHLQQPFSMMIWTR